MCVNAAKTAHNFKPWENIAVLVCRCVMILSFFNLDLNAAFRRLLHMFNRWDDA